MKRNVWKITLSMMFMVTLTCLAINAQAGKWGGGWTEGPRITMEPVQELTDDEVTVFSHMLEEEKLARDVYTVLAQTWGAIPFENIARSEQRHMDVLVALGQSYGLDVSVADLEPGSFVSQEFQEYYSDLVEMGQNSFQDALAVGVMIEELDIYDIQQSLNLVENIQLSTVLQNLMRGSRNHLRSFYAYLLAMDGEYTPEFLSLEEFDQIVNSEMERGRANENGRLSPRGGGQGPGPFSREDCPLI